MKPCLHIISGLMFFAVTCAAMPLSHPCKASLKEVQTRADHGWYVEAIGMVNCKSGIGPMH